MKPARDQYPIFIMPLGINDPGMNTPGTNAPVIKPGGESP